jgi:hypothetical protein
MYAVDMANIDNFSSHSPLLQASSNSSSTNFATTTTSLHMTTPSTAKSDKKPKMSAMEAFLNAVGDDTIPKSVGPRAALVEDLYNYRIAVTKYNSEHQPSVSSCMSFWQSHGTNFPCLSTIAKRFLCTPATSVPAESAFSISAHLARKERSRLSGENLAASVFLKVSFEKLTQTIQDGISYL